MMIHGIDSAHEERREWEKQNSVKLSERDGLGTLGDFYRENKHLSNKRYVGNFFDQF